MELKDKTCDLSGNKKLTICEVRGSLREDNFENNNRIRIPIPIEEMRYQQDEP